ncbi:hypothetical protein [Moheibacter stercoris]|uniref:Lipoprotein n=1 Tax=Moheibacter stercoris TaxID=1628251 RepID=A0ABV2LS50_9FLAO
MRKLLVPVFVGLLLVSCGGKEEVQEGDLTQEQVEILEENSQINQDQIEYEGTFKGKIKGKDVQLKLNGDTFEITEGSSRSQGNWSKVDDGTVIELEPKSGKVSVKYYGFSDNETWVALSDSMTYPEPEEYLKRIPN